MSGLVVAHTIAGMNPKSGGPVRSVAGLCSGLAAHDCETHLYYLAGRSEPGLPPREMEGVQIHPVVCGPRETSTQVYVGKYLVTLVREFTKRRFDVVQDHGIWLPTNIASAWVSEYLSIPRVVSVHGTLSKWALSYKGLKKKCAWHLYQRRILERATVIRATSDAEFEDVRALGLKTPVAVIPNGVPVREGLVPRTRESKPIRTALFIGRIHPVKGLDNLLDAWASVDSVGWHLIIAGPAENRHDRDLKDQVMRLGLSSRVTFRDEVNEPDKWALLRSSDLLVLPSYSENFGMVVAEALLAGLPVITTKGTPWQEVVRERCGWWVDANVNAISTALATALALRDDELWEMGDRGSEFVRNRYLWPSVAGNMVRLYEWIKFGGDAPAFLRES